MKNILIEEEMIYGEICLSSFILPFSLIILLYLFVQPLKGKQQKKINNQSNIIYSFFYFFSLSQSELPISWNLISRGK